MNTTHHLHVGNLILVLSIAIAAGIVLVVGLSAYTRWSIAWTLLTRKYPVTDVHKSGKKYSAQDGLYYRFHHHRRDMFSLNCMFCIQVVQEGLLVTGYFAMRSSILIPWPEVQIFEGSGMLSKTYLMILYDDDRQLKIYISREALTTISQNISPEQLRQAESLPQLITKRLDHDA
jgi:hypothetical protein